MLEPRSKKQAQIPNVLDHTYASVQNKCSPLHAQSPDEGLEVRMRNRVESEVSP